MNESPEASTVPIGKLFQTPPEQRVQWVKRFLESGLSIRKFSAQNQLGYQSLWRWVKKAKANQAADGAVEARSVVPAFTEIRLVPPVERADWVAELSLPSGKVVRLSKEVPACLLEQLLRVC